jgi:CubicO group peptidase (beta-lactamase class C family)
MTIQSRCLAHNLLPGILMTCLSVSAMASDAVLKEAIDSIRSAHGISATAYFVVTADEIEQFQMLGTTRHSGSTVLDADHLIRIGSITKTFTALAIAILAERREGLLHETVANIVGPKAFDNPWQPETPVKTAHLLEHTAGLRDLSKREFDFNTPVPLAKAFAVDPGSRRLAWPAGMHSSYSNSGAGIASAVIEAISGQGYEEFVRKEIFSPLGMNSARFSLDESATARLVSGYDSDGRTPIKYWHTLYRAFGAISVTPRDMVSFVQLFLNHGQHATQQLVSKATIERMLEPTTTLAAYSGLRYGYGLGIYQFQHRGVSFYGHGGDADGYLAFFAFSLELARGYFVVINAYNNPALRQMRRAIEDAIVGGGKPADTATFKLGGDQFALLRGTYRQVTDRFPRNNDTPTIDVSIADGHLYTETGGAGSRRRLVPTNLWHFRRLKQTVATIAFVPCSDRIYLQGDFGNYAKPAPGKRLARCPNAKDYALSTQRTPVPPIPQ